MSLRHGLSLGELAQLVKTERGLDVELTVVPAADWDGKDFPSTGLL